MMQNLRPLIVDLDGTLLRSDMLIESGFAFLRHNPWQVLRPLAWLFAGKAHLKAGLAAAVSLDAASPTWTRTRETRINSCNNLLFLLILCPLSLADTRR